jgi:hypothetical protein
MVTDQRHSSDVSSEQEAIRQMEKITWLFGLDEPNAGAYKVLSTENRALKKQLKNYHSQHNTLERRVKRLERDVGSIKIELEDLDKCVDRETVVNLIHEIVPSLINERSKGSYYSSESSEESDSVEIIEGPHRQRRRMRPRKVKRIVV